MGAAPSKDQVLYEQVAYGNVEGIKSLHRQGAGLEWVDRDGKTPLIHACMMPNGLPVVKTLLELGANVNAYRPGVHAGTPLHHAAKRGLEQTVNLLLSHGANPSKFNDGSQTALDLARAKGHCNVVRTIESRICLFSGWLRESLVPRIVEALAPQFSYRKIWAVVLPCDYRHPTNPSKFQLALYPNLQDAKPNATISLWKAEILEPNFNHPDPTVVVFDKSSKKRHKLLSANEGDKQQLRLFYNACNGIPQQTIPTELIPVVPTSAVPTTAKISASEDEELVMAINASIQSAIEEGVPFQSQPPLPEVGNLNDWGNSTQSSSHNGWAVQEPGSSSSAAVHENQKHDDLVASSYSQEIPPVIAPSAPPLTMEVADDGPIHYPIIDASQVELVLPKHEEKSEKEGQNNSSDSGACVICLDAAVEGACVPCGHMAGCMACLNDIKAKNWGCPVCRAKIDQIIRLYAV